MSSGLPMRRTGVAAIVLSMSPRKPLSAAAAQHRSVDEARRHGVDGDAAWSVLERQGLGQSVHCGLRGHVGRHVGRTRVGARRRDVDDAAPARLDHVGQHRLDAVEDAVEVDVDHPLPPLERDVVELLEAVQARGVDEDRDRTEFRADSGQRFVDLRAVGDVGGEGEVVFARLEVDDGDVVAVGAQPIDDRLTDAEPPPVTTAFFTYALLIADRSFLRLRISIPNMRTVLSRWSISQHTVRSTSGVERARWACVGNLTRWSSFSCVLAQ